MSYQKATVKNTKQIIIRDNKFYCPYCYENFYYKVRVDLFTSLKKSDIYVCPRCHLFSNYSGRHKNDVASRKIHYRADDLFTGCGKLHTVRLNRKAVNPPLNLGSNKESVTCKMCLRYMRLRNL